ncbi:MAG: glutathione synthase [Actinobacteria bacterium]|nr:glutathione synthase [Actinomycetota bacterium]
MRIAFFVNEVSTEIDEYTTTRLAKAAAIEGHEAWYVGLGDISQTPDQRLAAVARAALAKPDDTLTTFLERAQASDPERIRLDDLDAVFLRNDSIEDLHERPWANNLHIVFGQMLASRGVTVVNDPVGLSRASSKLYLEEFPAEVRPPSLVTRDADEIKDFVADVGPAILKPLYGAKGRNVFVVHGKDEPNLAQMTEAVLQDGYVIAQGYVEGGEDGDLRIFILEGELLRADGIDAAFRRVPQGNDPRANISTGGRLRKAEVGDVERGIAETMRDKLVADGMFFVGIDAIGDKVIEINAESAGGFQAVEHLYEVDMCPTILDALEARCRSGSGLHRPRDP